MPEKQGVSGNQLCPSFADVVIGAPFQAAEACKWCQTLFSMRWTPLSANLSFQSASRFFRKTSWFPRKTGSTRVKTGFSPLFPSYPTVPSDRTRLLCDRFFPGGSARFKKRLDQQLCSSGRKRCRIGQKRCGIRRKPCPIGFLSRRNGFQEKPIGQKECSNRRKLRPNRRKEWRVRRKRCPKAVKVVSDTFRRIPQKG